MTQGFPSVPPTMPGQIAAPVSNWPKVLGIISIVLGGLGLLNHACQTVGSFAGGALFSFVPEGDPQTAVMKKVMDKNASLLLVSGFLYIFLTGLSALLIIAGVKTLNRSTAGVKFHTWWAVAKMAVSVIAMIPGYLMMQNQFEVMREMGAAGGAGGGMPGSGFFAAMGLIGVFFGLIIACSYPVFLLIWFQRQAVKTETARWSA